MTASNSSALTHTAAVVAVCTTALAACSGTSSGPAQAVGGQPEGGATALAGSKPLSGAAGTVATTGGAAGGPAAAGGAQAGSPEPSGAAGATPNAGGLARGGSPEGGRAGERPAAPGGGALQGGGGGGGTNAGGASGGGAPGGCPGLFCEDFESGVLDAARWRVSRTGANTAEVQAERAAHGRYAARFHYAGTRNTWAFWHASALAAALATRHFGRAFVYLTPGLPNRHTVFVTAGTEGFPNDTFLEVAGQGTQFQLSAVDLTEGGESYEVGGTLPVNRWFCLEWEFDDAPDRAVLFADEAEILRAPTFTVGAKSSGIVGGFAVLGIGLRAWGSGGGDTPYDLYYDDIVLDAERVGCP